MSAITLERQFRRLLILVELTCIGAIVELILEKHYKELNQLIPFGLRIFAIITVAGVLLRPGKATINGMRLAMVLLIAGSLIGMALHYQSNWEFEAEMRPNAAMTNVLWLSLMGAAPLLAPDSWRWQVYWVSPPLTIIRPSAIALM
jgi:hypothetical protein